MMPLTVVAATVFATGCGLISADFEGDVRVTFDFDEEGSRYEGFEFVNPDDYQDYADNKDRIKDGELIGMELAIIDVPQRNNARQIFGQVDVRRAGVTPDAPTPEFITAVAEWQGVDLVENNAVDIELSPAAKAQVDDLLFSDNAGPIDLRIVGTASIAIDQTSTPTVAFTGQITIRLRFTAGI